MRNNFISNGLHINVGRKSDNKISLSISSEYSRTNHKGQLYFGERGEKALCEEVEKLWKSIKTKKLLDIQIRFDEVDYYDNEVDVYDTPIVGIKRGLRKAKVQYQNHGAIPKDWDFIFSATFEDMSTSTPLLEVIKATLGSHFSVNLEKEFKKKLKGFLQKKDKYFNVQNEIKEQKPNYSSKFYGSNETRLIRCR